MMDIIQSQEEQTMSENESEVWAIKYNSSQSIKKSIILEKTSNANAVNLQNDLSCYNVSRPYSLDSVSQSKFNSRCPL